MLTWRRRVRLVLVGRRWLVVAGAPLASAGVVGLLVGRAGARAFWRRVPARAVVAELIAAVLDNKQKKLLTERSWKRFHVFIFIFFMNIDIKLASIIIVSRADAEAGLNGCTESSS